MDPKYFECFELGGWTADPVPFPSDLAPSDYVRYAKHDGTHEYATPRQEEAEDFIDVVQLFLCGTQRLLSLFPSVIELYAPPIYGDDVEELDMRTEYLEIKWTPGSGKLMLKASLLTISAAELVNLLAGIKEPDSSLDGYRRAAELLLIGFLATRRRLIHFTGRLISAFICR